MLTEETRPKYFRGRIETLDGLRGIAVLMVLIHHAYHARLLWMGVDIFFVLSGFLITRILLKAKDQPGATFGGFIKDFYKRRAKRILPPYLLLLGMFCLTFGFAAMGNPFRYLGVMNHFHLPEQLGILWSLAIEEQFYLVWPFAVFFLSRKHLAFLSIALIVAAPILRCLCTPLFPDHFPIYGWLPFRMDTLVWGAMIAQILTAKGHDIKIPYKDYYAPVVGIIMMVIALIVMGHAGVTTHSNTRFSNVWIYETTIFIAMNLIAIALTGIHPRIFTVFSKFGTISYSLYLFHMFFLSLLPTVPALITTLLFAIGSWKLIEEPILTGKRIL